MRTKSKFGAFCAVWVLLVLLLFVFHPQGGVDGPWFTLQGASG